jgi:hypothetical protein
MKFTSSKSITTASREALSTAREMFPGLGHAYSDKLKNGRRYKFCYWDPDLKAKKVIKSLNEKFNEMGLNAEVYFLESKWSSRTGNGICIKVKEN